MAPVFFALATPCKYLPFRFCLPYGNAGSFIDLFYLWPCGVFLLVNE